MSAYNRKVLKKTCSGTGSFDTDSVMDESGYASFKVLHNSTVEAPFLFERNCETENCRNASNTTVCVSSLHKSTFNSIQFQTPGSSSSCGTGNQLNCNAKTTLWGKSLSLPAGSSMQLESEDEDEDCKSPLPLPLSLSNQLTCAANKRRKSHYQPMAHHSSPKKSKKKLFPQAAQPPICRTRYYNGLEQLDIIGMLSNTLPALECILAQVSSHTLDVMTKVSERWSHAVYKSQRATERLQNHRFKMNLCKENEHYFVKRGRMMSNSINSHLVPLQPSNAIHKPNRPDNYKSVPMDDDCLLVEHMQRIKCPRCGKCSKVFSRPAAEQAAAHTPRYTKATLSQTLPHANSFSERKPSLTRFYSLDKVQGSPDETEGAKAGEPGSFAFGECTSVFCKFRFCVHCFCQPHPGKKCLVTELGTPSKVMMPSEKVTPPKRTQKYDSKLIRKNSLKRLNF